MSVQYNTNIVRNGLVLHLDAATPKSYPGTGTAWNDLSGNNRNATLINSVSYNSTAGGVMDFTRPVGTQGYATIPHDATISSQVFGTSTTFALCAWVYPRSFNNYGTLIQKASAGSYSNSTAGLWVETNGIGIVVGSNVAANPTGWGFAIRYSAVPNAWYYVVGIGDGTNATLFVNGESIGTVPFSSITVPRTENTSSITIGTRAVGSSPELDALVGPIAVYNRALSASEVSQNFNALRWRFGL